MKRSLWWLGVAVLSVGLTDTGHAQTWTVGAKLGVNVANLAGDIEDLVGAETSNRPASSVGAFVATEVHRLIELQLLVQYQQKGA